MATDAPRQRSSTEATTRVVIGTAGHVDHGKTSLVRALTGIETDRLPEEKARGISIELGFARMRFDSGRTAALIDVPGHERFVRAMVAGATGIDLALVVVAADEGVMPQTREHLDICRLLGVSRGLIALNKFDLVDEEVGRLATEEVREAVRGTFLERAPVIPCSAVTGLGLERLRSALERAVASAPVRAIDGPARLPIDRVFSVKGFGTVVTGTLATGRLAVGAVVEALPSGVRGKVRSLEVHGEPREVAEAGERVAANLHGIARDEIGRGEVLAPEGAVVASTVVEVELSSLAICPTPLATGNQLLFHALTAQQEGSLMLLGGGSLQPGETTFAQLRLSRPMALLPEDRFVLRGFRPLAGHGTTIAGGRIVRVDARRLRRPSPAERERVARVASATPEERVALELEAAGPSGITAQGLWARSRAPSELVDRALHRLLSMRQAFTIDPASTRRMVSAAALQGPKGQILATVERFHAGHPLLPGIGREELRSSPGLAAIEARVLSLAVAELEREGRLETDHELVRLRGFTVSVAEADREALVKRVAATLAEQGLAPPSPAVLAETLRTPPAEIQTALEILVRRGELVRLKGELYFHREAVTRLRASLGLFLAAHGEITAQQFKELAGQSRKYAIPLAEYFDAEKVTLRVGEIRRRRS
jgi:selenocysteine-specific elongation factor